MSSGEQENNLSVNQPKRGRKPGSKNKAKELTINNKCIGNHSIEELEKYNSTDLKNKLEEIQLEFNKLDQVLKAGEELLKKKEREELLQKDAEFGKRVREMVGDIPIEELESLLTKLTPQA